MVKLSGDAHHSYIKVPGSAPAACFPDNSQRGRQQVMVQVVESLLPV